MSTSTPASPTLLFFFLLLIARPPPSNGFSYFQYRIVFSLTHSLMMRGATLRASRGDHSGADRARSIAKMIGKVGGPGIWRQMSSISWDYMKNYSWEDMSFNDMNELRLFLKELTQIEWNLVQKEVVDGGLLWDCLEVGRGDLKGLIQIVKDVAEQFSSSYASRGDHSGADRARSIAKMTGKVGGHGLWRQMWSISWDYMKNYSWEDMSPSDMFDAFKGMNELRLFLRELTQIESNLVQKKVVDGGLLWDCLEVGRGDSKGLMQIVKDVAEQFSSSYASRGDHSGADRTRSIAKMIGKVGGLGLCRLMWSIGSDYVKNYPWIDTSPTDMFGGFKDYERGDVEM